MTTTMPIVTVQSAVTAILAASFVLAMVILGTALAGCPLRDPAPTPITPDYPSTARDAGHE